MDVRNVREILETTFGSPSPSGEDISSSDINFDRTLPGLHKYLRADFVDVGGRTFLEPGSETHMYAFFRAGVVLVPGHSLPLIPYGPLESDLLQKLNKEKKPLIFLPGYSDYTSLADFVGCIGTTADLVAICIPDSGEDAPICAMFIGRQRIRITKATRDSSYPLVCHGEILPESSFNREMATHPLGWGLVPRSWSRFARDPQPTRPSTCISTDSVQSTKASDDRSLHKSNSSCPESNPITINSCNLPAGNPFSIFDSRLSTWRSTGPINSSDVSSSCCSTGARFDHFVDESLEQESNSKKVKCDLDKIDNRNDTDVSCASSHNDAAQSMKPATKLVRSSSLSEDVELIVDRAVDRVGRPFRYRIKQQCDPRLLARRDVLAAVAQTYVPLPFWVYRQYDLNFAQMCGSSSRHTPCSTRSKRRKYKKSIIETVSRGVRQRINNEEQNSFIGDHKSQGVDASAPLRTPLITVIYTNIFISPICIPKLSIYLIFLELFSLSYSVRIV
uniref:DNA_pol_E_B domain-containing protein n=1 Tax=Trichobilharzia regenti TaxID=157069 RepID=A0AA85K1G8_TRIRE|nr:unnamed protein product [Trichobilharzia regenti]